MWPLLQRLFVGAKQGVHRLRQRFAHPLAKRSYGQHTLTLEALQCCVQCFHARLAVIHGVALGGNQSILQLPVL